MLAQKYAERNSDRQGYISQKWGGREARSTAEQESWVKEGEREAKAKAGVVAGKEGTLTDAAAKNLVNLKILTPDQVKVALESNPDTFAKEAAKQINDLLIRIDQQTIENLKMRLKELEVKFNNVEMDRKNSKAVSMANRGAFSNVG